MIIVENTNCLQNNSLPDSELLPLSTLGKSLIINVTLLPGSATEAVHTIKPSKSAYDTSGSGAIVSYSFLLRSDNTDNTYLVLYSHLVHYHHHRPKKHHPRDGPQGLLC